MLWLRLDPRLALPARLHTHVLFPPPIQASRHPGIQAESRTATATVYVYVYVYVYFYFYFYRPRDSQEDESVQRRAMDAIPGQVDG